jgi:serine/threonine protein kinase
MAGSIIGQQYDNFQAKGDTSLVTCVDMTKHPLFKDHPAVAQRPHVTAWAAKLLITEDNHPMGLLFVWDSKLGHEFSKEVEEKFSELALEARMVLERSMLRGISTSNESPDSKNSRSSTDEEASPSGRQLASVWIDMDDPEWRVLGINKQWENLTGVGLDTFSDYPGLLSVMIPSDGSDTTAMRVGILEAIKTTAIRNGATIPAILSPRASSGGSLQYAMALKRAIQAPPMRVFEDDTASASPPMNTPNVWVVEVHARVQADVHIGEFSSTDLHSIVGLISDSGSDGGSLHNTGGSFSGSLSGAVSAGTPIGIQAPRIPPRLASLKIGRLIGSGSYANVYAGFLGSRPVAVKVMHHSHGPDSFREEWTSHYEALMTVDIAHENVVTTLDWCRLEDPRGVEVWIVQELCERGSLSAALHSNIFGGKSVLSTESTLNTEEGEFDAKAANKYKVILQTAREVALGMRYLHSEDEMHGDLSSNNVLLTNCDNARGFIAKVTDFGLSRASKDEVTTKTVGTVSHMPPELLLEGLMTKAGDVYSFGVILYELWTGKRAWDKLSQAQVIFAVTCRNEFLKMPEDAPPEYRALAMQCMSPNRNERPTFDEIVPRLDSLLAAVPGFLSSASAAGLRKSIAELSTEQH